MRHINIEAVDAQAATFEAFASHPGLATFEADDYRARAENLRQFAKQLRGWRELDARMAEQDALMDRLG